MSLTLGLTLHNRYRIDALLGQGGMGAVYRAWDLNLDIAVVVKENLGRSPEAQKQFAREAGLLAGLRHPNLPRVTDHFFLPGQDVRSSVFSVTFRFDDFGLYSPGFYDVRVWLMKPPAA